jgi:hypothetical protein
MKKRPRITSFSVGRVYNLGNYENIRLDLSVEVPEGESVRAALTSVMGILKAASPKPPVQAYSVEHARKQLEDPQAWHKNIVIVKERKAAIRCMVKDAKATVSKWEAWKASRKLALEALDAIGATSIRKDHKNDWNDEEEY